jgi:hypothetical protein
MLEVESTKSVVTCFNISIYDSWSIDQDQLVVEIDNKKYFVMSASINKDWTSEATEYKLEMLKEAPCGEVRLVSVLKNGKAGNDYRNPIIYRNSFGGIFAHLFDAYNQEFAKTQSEQSEQLVGAN